MALALTACGGSGATTGSSGPTGDTAALATTAKAAADKLLTRPTELKLGQKISKPIPTDKKLVTVNCGFEACTILDGLTGDAAKSLGWAVEEIQTDGSAQQISNAWQQAIRGGASAIVQAGAVRSQIEPYIKQAQQAGIQVILTATDEAAGNGVLAVLQDKQQSAVQGTYAGIWVANDALQTNQPSADTVYVNIPDFTILPPIEAAYKQSLLQYCPGCKVDELNIGISTIQQAPDLVVSYLRSHPSVKYVVFSARNIFDAVPPAMKAAGLTSVKTADSGAPGSTSLNQLRSGLTSMNVAYPVYNLAYATVDVLARHFAGVSDSEPPAPYEIPGWALTKDNAPSDNVFPIVANTVAQYKALWGK
ncbi:sugar ABC transporter substrate-binding protein [Pseudonocardia ailaonensis]